MKIVLNEDRELHGKDYTAGATVNVKKDLAERLIKQGLANRVVEEPENRGLPSGPRRFSNHKIFGR